MIPDWIIFLIALLVGLWAFGKDNIRAYLDQRAATHTFLVLLDSHPSEKQWYLTLSEQLDKKQLEEIRQHYLDLLNMSDYWKKMSRGEQVSSYQDWGLDSIYLTALLYSPLTPSSLHKDYLDFCGHVKAYYTSDNLPSDILSVYQQMISEEDENAAEKLLGDLAELVSMVYFHACANENYLLHVGKKGEEE